MPIYDFLLDYSLRPSLSNVPAQYPVAAGQASHADVVPGILTSEKQGRTDVTTGALQQTKEELEDFLIPGFRALDQSMKAFWSGLRVPTKESYRFLRMKMAGGDRSILIWRDELSNGRARLPVGALNHQKEEFNKDKFSPAYHPMSIRYTSQRGNLAVLTYRPTPWLVEYSLSVWSEHKRDAEYIKFQILNRFNPLAEFVMSDGHIRGTVTIRFGGAADNSDREVTYDQHRLIKHDYTMTAEAWLPLPERLIPTVLGQVVSVKNRLGDVLMYAMGQSPPL